MQKSEIYLAALAKAKVAFNARSDKALAEILELDRTAIAKAKLRGTAPVKNLVEACIKHQVSIDHIFGITPKSSE
ncbi:helix-turn-helix domain-containing protein [Sulfuricurvum sp.]|uniref:helix-turn-helix domain-containing protein n=1 Tax=Sulfuricurvum sp. TaxID=2025608 RepID=UPI002612BA77|nr:helix-turn-helix domain-containing protein [Sulfuricurvum sp.]MDD2267432.1 hypothetical protein [Sulfuricurvum sp.]MDD2782846.1 hypothetical protein [Sulfuricurvum sp.]